VVLGGDMVTDADYVVDIDLTNGTSGGDGLQLLDCTGAVVDTVIYGNSNTDLWPEDDGTIPEDAAPKPSDDRSLGRTEDGVDTDDSSADWSALSSPTPGATNTVPPRECDGQEFITVNEFFADPAEESETGFHWVELYNSGGADVDLADWQLQWDGTDLSDASTYAFGAVTLSAGDYLVIGEEFVAEADLIAESLALTNASSNADALRLVDCNADPVDTVLYGTKNVDEDNFADDDDAICPDEQLAPKASSNSGQSVGRNSDGVDTNDSAIDFRTFPNPTPGLTNDIPACDGHDAIKINEFMPDPNSEGGDTGAEWIELMNTSGASVSLSGWTVWWGTSNFESATNSYTFPEGATLSAGAFVVIGGTLVPEADYVVVEPDGDTGGVSDALDMGNAGPSSADGLLLTDCNGLAADTVIYGGTNDGDWEDDSGEVTTSLAPDPEVGVSIGRCTDGLDTDQSGDDFSNFDAPSPGEDNPTCRPCVPGTGVVKINEVYPNPEGTDSDQEFIELFNTGSESVALDGWILETASSSWGDTYTFPSNVNIGPGEFVLVGGSFVETEYQWSTASPIGNASSAPDGARLLDCQAEPAVQDTVLWGQTGDPVEDTELLDDAGGSTFGPLPEEGFTFGRYPDGEDSNDNAVDLVSMGPTPGSANAEGGSGGGDGGDGGGPGGKGCGKSDDDEAGTSKSCSVSSGPLSLGWLALGLAALRRRRRP
jgi:MYXO-CTERM domain-containing protein